jgi:hypothetical protein
VNRLRGLRGGGAAGHAALPLVGAGGGGASRAAVGGVCYVRMACAGRAVKGRRRVPPSRGVVHAPPRRHVATKRAHSLRKLLSDRLKAERDAARQAAGA